MVEKSKGKGRPKREGLSRSMKEYVALISRDPELTSEEIANLMGVSVNLVYWIRRELKKNGYVFDKLSVIRKVENG